MPPFDSVDDYVALPRVTGLRLSPDGSRLVASVSAPARDGKTFVTSLWDIDPDGTDAPRRLTFSNQSAASPAIAPDGSVLFLAKRPDSDPALDDRRRGEEMESLWLLPAGGGESRRLAARPGGFGGLRVAADAGTVVVAGDVLPAATDDADDARLRKAREDRDIRAILHEQSPVRYWDRDLGPGEPRLMTGVSVDSGLGADSETTTLRHLTPASGRALDEAELVILRDGSAVISTWAVHDEAGLRRNALVEIDLATGERRLIADEPYVSFEHPAVSADGRRVACIRSVDGTYDDPPRRTLWLIDRDSGSGREVATDDGLWLTSVTFGPDADAVYLTADHNGRHPIFRLGVDDERLTRVASDGHYSDVCVSPDGRTLFALHDRIDQPPTPVRLDAEGIDQKGTVLPAPGAVTVPGRVEEVFVDGVDGHPMRGWLVVP